jgi:flagellum-specific ATP synthase
MTLRLNVERLKQTIADCGAFQIAGRLSSVRGVVAARLPAAVGELCKILRADGSVVLAEVIAFDGQQAQIMPLRPVDGLGPGDVVIALRRHFLVPTGVHLLGRVVDALGRPLDGKGPLRVQRWVKILQHPPHPLHRPPIRRPFVTGTRAIDGLMPIGIGQRIGLFAGSGVGKSMLLGEIAKFSASDVNVVALIGERGREVRPMIEDCLGANGLARSVVVVATIDEAPLARLRAAETAVTIAGAFRESGQQVLLMLDSLTRVAAAQRELGLIVGEPPTVRGYPPSTFQVLSGLVERLGCTPNGSITGILTVLVDGDDLAEPVTDAVRAVLDGHIVLDRRLANRGHFPAINVGSSLSRLVHDIVEPQHLADLSAVREMLQVYDESASLIQIGAYQQGTSAAVDRAIRCMPLAEAFLRQPLGQPSRWSDSLRRLRQLAAACTAAESPAKEPPR